MFIQSYDKKTLMEATQMHVERNLGGKKDEKYVLTGSAQCGTRILGLYPTMEDAIAEIERIAAAITEGVSVYTISACEEEEE